MLQAYGLATHIRANRLRTLFLLLSFVGLLIALLYSVCLFYEAMNGGTVAQMMTRAWVDLLHRWPLAVGAALAWFAIAYFFQSRMIDFATGAELVSRTAAPKLYNALENLCISRGLKMPALKIIESDALNAYASGMSEEDYAVTVTRGLSNTLDDAEIEAVLGHELTHIRNKDVQLMVVAVIFAGVFAFVGDMTFRNWNFPFGYTPSRGSSRDRDKGSSGAAIIVVVIALAVIAVSWGLSVLIRFAISRKREFLADAGSVELTRNPDAMISALRKIEAHAYIPGIQSRVSAFFIESPLQDEGTGWLSTHPSMSDRIAALTRYAGGIDTGALDVLPRAAGQGRFLPEPGEAAGIAPARPVFGKRKKSPWG